MSKISEMRREICHVYGPGFANPLPPRQVVAIYKNMKSRGAFEKRPGGDFRQMTLEDWVLQQGKEIELWETT